MEKRKNNKRYVESNKLYYKYIFTQKSFYLPYTLYRAFNKTTPLTLYPLVIPYPFLLSMQKQCFSKGENVYLWGEIVEEQKQASLFLLSRRCLSTLYSIKKHKGKLPVLKFFVN